MKKSSVPETILVTGGAGFIGSHTVDFWQKNLDFLFGVFDWATGDSGLAQVRAKADDDRPLAFKSEGQKKALTYGLVFGLPAGFILLALVRLGFRRMARRRLTVTA